MPTIDFAMPLLLLLVVTVALIIYKRASKRLDASVENQPFQTKDKLMIAGAIIIGLATLTLTFFHNPGDLFGNIVLSLFLGSYTLLLFNIAYLFSDIKKRGSQLFSIGFGVASLIFGIGSTVAQLKHLILNI
jgi:quinol-cytochrome oxidoreductase complex cytochrome b subunit